MKKVAVVLGSQGLLGQEVCRSLIKDYEIVAIDKVSLVKIEIPHGVKYHQYDVTDIGTIDFILTEEPTLIINCVNLATRFSLDPVNNYQEAIKFYLNLYRKLSSTNSSIHYIQVGTTGSGGLGFDLPFTHGEKIEDLPIIHKAAFAGIGTSLLTLLSRSFENNHVSTSEIKPGLAVFSSTITKSIVGQSKLITLKGGESGDYTYNELALLTSFMGFTTVERVAGKVIDLIRDKTTSQTIRVHDIIDANNQTILSQEKNDLEIRDRLLQQMKAVQGENYIITTGNLGPPSLTLNLVLGYIISKYGLLINNEFNDRLRSDTSIKDTLSYINQRDAELKKFIIKQLNYQYYMRHSGLIGKRLEPWKVAEQLIQLPR